MKLSIKKINIENMKKEINWELNTDVTNLKVGDRKNVYILLEFLNYYQEYPTALKMLRKEWLNRIYPIPPIEDAKHYNVIRKSRHTIMKRFKDLYRDYIIQA